LQEAYKSQTDLNAQATTYRQDLDSRCKPRKAWSRASRKKEQVLKENEQALSEVRRKARRLRAAFFGFP